MLRGRDLACSTPLSFKPSLALNSSWLLSAVASRQAAAFICCQEPQTARWHSDHSVMFTFNIADILILNLFKPSQLRDTDPARQRQLTRQADWLKVFVWSVDADVRLSQISGSYMLKSNCCQSSQFVPLKTSETDRHHGPGAQRQAETTDKLHVEFNSISSEAQIQNVIYDSTWRKL